VRTISLYDTRTRAVRPLEPRDPGKVGIYACGPTFPGSHGSSGRTARVRVS